MILLDTHIVLWLAFHPEKLSRRAASDIKSAREERGGLAIAAVSLYEITMLAAKRRIELRSSPERFLDEVEAQFIVKPISSRICAEAMRLPETYPGDPMDRLIGATAIVEGLALVSADVAIQNSKAFPTIW